MSDGSGPQQALSAYETIYKGGLSIYDHGFVFKTDASTGKAAIDWLKQQGAPFKTGFWPDGRRLEDVIKWK
jgi:hypothetical protein